MTFDGNLEGVKVGDYIYCNVKYGEGLSRTKVLRETDKSFVIDHDSKVRKSDGYVIGSDSGGRFGHFNQVSYFKSTPEIELRYKIQHVKSAILNFGKVPPDKIDITPENMDGIISAINTIRSVIEKEPK